MDRQDVVPVDNNMEEHSIRLFYNVLLRFLLTSSKYAPERLSQLSSLVERIAGIPYGLAAIVRLRGDALVSFHLCLLPGSVHSARSAASAVMLVCCRLMQCCSGASSQNYTAQVFAGDRAGATTCVGEATVFVHLSAVHACAYQTRSSHVELTGFAA